MMRSTLCALFATTLLLGMPLLAQDAAPQQTPAGPPTPVANYKLSFIVRQLVAGKVTESRSYSSLFLSGSSRPDHIRAGDKIPQAPLQSQSGTQSSYNDVGVNLDFDGGTKVDNLTTRQLAIRVSAEVSQAVDADIKEGIYRSILRQDRWESNFVIELGKPTLLFSSDDPTLDRTTQVELTAVKVP